jgi:hypothetical protein
MLATLSLKPIYIKLLTYVITRYMLYALQSEKLTSLANAVGAGMEAANTSIHEFVLRHAEVQLQPY